MMLILPFESASKKIDALKSDFPFKFEELDPKKDLEEAYSEDRNQYNAHNYLSSCQKAGRKNDVLVLGITDVDLFVPDLNFVFGLAEKNGFGCVISTNRLGKGNILKERMIKEGVHEIGHVIGLEHCMNQNCVMYFSNSLSDTDRKTGWFCDNCQQKFKSKIGKRTFELDY